MVLRRVVEVCRRRKSEGWWERVLCIVLCIEYGWSSSWRCCRSSSTNIRTEKAGDSGDALHVTHAGTAARYDGTVSCRVGSETALLFVVLRTQIGTDGIQLSYNILVCNADLRYLSVALEWGWPVLFQS